MIYEKISKRTKNSILARIKATVKKYGFEETKTVFTRYFNAEIAKKKLLKEISQKEEKLKELKKKAGEKK